MEKTLTQGKEYYTWIDYAKFISIFLVVSYHVPFYVEGFWGEFLTGLRLPLFFFLSGFLFKSAKYVNFHSFFVHRGRQLLIPYFCFFVIFYILWLFAGKKMGNEADLEASFLQPLMDCLYGRPRLVCAPMWFISCLFLLQCMYYFINKYIRINWLIVITLIGLSYFYLVIQDIRLPWMLEKACRFILFYGVASCFKSQTLNLIHSKSRNLISIAFIGLYTLGVYLKMQSENEVLINTLYVICGLLVIFPIINLSRLAAKVLGSNRWVQYITANAIVILAMQNYVIGTFKIVFFNLLHINESSLNGRFDINLILSITMLLLMTIPIYLINKYCPFILGKKSEKKESTLQPLI